MDNCQLALLIAVLTALAQPVVGRANVLVLVAYAIGRHARGNR